MLFLYKHGKFPWEHIEIDFASHQYIHRLDHTTYIHTYIHTVHIHHTIHIVASLTTSLITAVGIRLENCFADRSMLSKSFSVRCPVLAEIRTTCVPAHTQGHIHSYKVAILIELISTYIYLQMHTYIHTYIHTYTKVLFVAVLTYLHTYIHTYIQ